ncbi:hypothetical protein HBI79_100500 [Parastagonospora nodorum]|nr:hypothetical protein HBI79_100500 [Parastagonospora nodorum]
MASQNSAENSTRRTVALNADACIITTKIGIGKRRMEAIKQELAVSVKPAKFDAEYAKVKDVVAAKGVTIALTKICMEAVTNYASKSISGRGLEVLKAFQVEGSAATVGGLELFPEVMLYQPKKSKAKTLQSILQGWGDERRSGQKSPASSLSSKSDADEDREDREDS